MAVKEDIILDELHELSIEEWVSRLRHYLFVSRTNIVRFVNSVARKRKAEYSDVFELSLISTTLEANISDAKDFLCRERAPFIKQIPQEDAALIVDIININISNFVTALKILSGKTRIIDAVLKENIKKIIAHCHKISGYYRNTQLEELVEELEKYL